jgi:hypothetical protein
MDWFSLANLGDIGSTGLVILFVIAILTGRLRPQSAVVELRADRDARLAEKDAQHAKNVELLSIFEKAYNTAEAARMDQAKVIQQLMSAMDTVQRIYSSDERSRGGDNGPVQ